MDWYRVHHGLPTDTKLAVVARRAGLKRGEVLALWVTLLDHASQAVPRGTLAGLDPEQLCVILDFDPAQIETALAALRDKEMITADDGIAGWEERQTLSSTQRVRAFRQRRRITAAPEKSFEKTSYDDEKAVAARRQRLQAELLARRGAKTPATGKNGETPA